MTHPTHPPDIVHLWRPRADEHALAQSLGLVEYEPHEYTAVITEVQRQLAEDLPGVPIRVHRWHVWRVVRALHTLGALNTPEGRSLAYTYLATLPTRSQRDDR